MLRVDFSQFIDQWLPPKMRADKKVILLKVLLGGLQTLCKDFEIYSEQKDLEVNASSQRKVLELLLKKNISSKTIILNRNGAFGFDVYIPADMLKHKERITNLVEKYKLAGIPYTIKTL